MAILHAWRLQVQWIVTFCGFNNMYNMNILYRIAFACGTVSLAMGCSNNSKHTTATTIDQDPTSKEMATWKLLSKAVVADWEDAGAQVQLRDGVMVHGVRMPIDFHVRLIFTFETTLDTSKMSLLPNPSEPFVIVLGTKYRPAKSMELKGLERFSNLKVLYVGEYVKVHSGSLKTLSGLRNLEELYLESNNNVSDVNLKELIGMKLKALTIPRQAQTDLGLKLYIELVDSRRILDLKGWSITDLGINELANLEEVESIDISNTKVTDAGLNALAKITNLRTLNLSGTHVTRNGIEKLQNTIPKCIILFDNERQIDKGRKTEPSESTFFPENETIRRPPPKNR